MAQFPNQKLTEAQKKAEYGSVDKWAQAMCDVIERASSVNGHNGLYDLNVLYGLSEGKFDPTDANSGKYTKPYGEAGEYSFPAEFDHKDRISPIFHLLYGEEIKRPFKYRAIKTGSAIASELEEEETQMMHQILDQKLQAKLQEQGIIPGQVDPEKIPTPKVVQKYLRYDRSDIHEVAANHAIQDSRYALDLPFVFAEGWKHLLISKQEVYRCGIRAGRPYARAVDSRFFDYERFPGQKTIQEAGWMVEWRYMPAHLVVDEYFEEMTEKYHSKLEELKGLRNAAHVGDLGPGRAAVHYLTGSDMVDGLIQNEGSTIVRVIDFFWMSKKKVGFVTYIDEDGEAQEKIVDEDYKPAIEPVYLGGIKEAEFLLEGEHIDWNWINQWWGATKVGNDMYLGIRPLPRYGMDLDNPNAAIAPYCGIVTDYSLAEQLRPLQYLLNRIWYRLELMIARAKGKILINDLSQLPKSENMSIKQQQYYMDVYSQLYINSMEEGRGKFQGQRSMFNQWREFDLTLSQAVGQLIDVVTKIEEMIGHVSGVSEQRLGNIETNELVNNVNRSVTQSSHITEFLFFNHDKAKRMVLEHLLEYAKIAYPNGHKGQYITDQMERVFYSMDPEFANHNYGIFVSNSAKEDQIIEQLRNIAMQAVQSGTATLSEVAKVLKSESIVEAEKLLEEIDERMAQAQQAQAEADQASAETEQMLRMEELAIMEENNVRDNETRRYVADKGSAEGAVVDDGASVDREKLAHQKIMDQRDDSREERRVRLEERKQQLAERKQARDEQFKAQEIAIKRKVANKPTPKPSSSKR
jgi:hypothetical protein